VGWTIAFDGNLSIGAGHVNRHDARSSLEWRNFALMIKAELKESCRDFFLEIGRLRTGEGLSPSSLYPRVIVIVGRHCGNTAKKRSE
jgi:hypothetical protein